MRIRYLSLYFALIGQRQVLLTLYSGFTSALTGDLRLNKLAKRVKLQYGANLSLYYCSARASIAEFLEAAG